MTEEVYKKLKREVEETKAEAERAQGALQSHMERLESDFSCGTLKEARAKLEQLETSLADANEAFEKALAAYKEKWHPDDN